MMTFEEWIATQDETKFDLDEASVQSIKDWFRYREICDDDKMETFFWRQLRLYRYKYKQMLRMETTQFDPLVNRYFEAEYTTNQSTSGTNSSGTTSESSTSSSDTTSGTTTYGATVTNSGQDDTIHGTTVHTEGADHNIETDLRSIRNKYEKGTTYTTNDTGYTEQKDTRKFHDVVNTDYGRTDTETKTNLKTDTTKQTILKHEEDNVTSDKAHRFNKTKSANSNNNISDSNNTLQHAEKIAPMSAVNVTGSGSYRGMTQTGETNDLMNMADVQHDIATYTAVSKHIPTNSHMDFSYATGYTQDDTYNHGTEQSSGSSLNNNESYVEGDVTVTKKFRYQDPNGDYEHLVVTENGKDAHALSGRDSVTTDREVKEGTLKDTRYLISKVVGRGSDTDTRTVEGDLINHLGKEYDETTSGTDSFKHGHVITNGGSDSNSGSHSGTGSSSTETNTTGSTSSSTTGTNRNRYTGREGLTPQEGLSRAMDYLMGYSPAFAWLRDRLEPCFIGILDADDYYCL